MTDTVGLPGGWTRATLPDLIGPEGLLTDGDWVETEDQDPVGNVRLTQLADIGDGVFRDRSARFMTHERAAALNCTFLQKGDVLVARMPDPLGRACLFPGSATPCVTAVDVCIVRPALPSVSSRWLMNTINAPEFRNAIAQLQSGSTRKRISKKNLTTIPLPVPPTGEQNRIVEAIESYLTRLDNALALLERVEENLKRYRASVLKAAVEGRLVPTEAELARREGRDLPAPRPGTYYVYAIACEGGSNYIGQTDNIPRRWQEHVEGKGASWTRRHRPLRLVHWEEYGSREEAVEREKHLKTGFGRKWLRREIAAGRTRQAGYEPASELLKRILAERKTRWIEDAAEKARAKTEEKARKAGKPWTAEDDDATLEKERAKAAKQYKEPATADTTDLPGVPEGWCWASLDQLAASMTNGLAKRRGGTGRLVHVLRLADVLQGEIGGAEPRDILMDDAEVGKYGLEAGDLLSIRVNGSRRLAGLFVPFDQHDEWAFCDHFIRVRLVGDDLAGTYVLGVLNTGIARNHIAAGMVTTAGQNTVNQTTLGTAPLALPPAAEQTRIAAEVARLTSVAACEEGTVSGQIKRGSRLRQSILKWAFEGKLVEQDPSNEPAAVLLERIRAERATAGAPKARGRKKRSAE